MRSGRAVPVLRRAPMSPLAVRLSNYGAGIIARSDALGTAIATLILGSSLAGAVVLALRSTAAVRSSGEAHWRALAMLAALLSVVLLSGVVAARP